MLKVLAGASRQLRRDQRATQCALGSCKDPLSIKCHAVPWLRVLCSVCLDEMPAVNSNCCCWPANYIEAGCFSLAAALLPGSGIATHGAAALHYLQQQAAAAGPATNGASVHAIGSWALLLHN
jgi:hypothetical protein